MLPRVPPVVVRGLFWAVQNFLPRLKLVLNSTSTRTTSSVSRETTFWRVFVVIKPQSAVWPGLYARIYLSFWHLTGATAVPPKSPILTAVLLFKNPWARGYGTLWEIKSSHFILYWNNSRGDRSLLGRPQRLLVIQLTHPPPPRPNGHHFADDIFMCISMNEKFFILSIFFNTVCF